MYVRAALCIFMCSSAPVVAQSTCAPDGAVLVEDRVHRSPPVDQSIPKNGVGMFVVDISAGMSGFIRQPADSENGIPIDADDMIFSNVVVLAQRAFSQVKNGHLLSAGTETDVFALDDTELRVLPNLAVVLASCKSKCSKSVDLPQKNSDYKAFSDRSGSEVKSLLGQLGTAMPLLPAPRAIGPQDLVVIVTDLQNESVRIGAGELGELLSKLVARPGIDAAILPFRSSFSGTINDLPGIRGYPLSKGLQPFFVIAVGGSGLVKEFVKSTRTELDAGAPPFPDLIASGMAQVPILTSSFRQGPELAAVPAESEKPAIWLRRKPLDGQEAKGEALRVLEVAIDRGQDAEAQRPLTVIEVGSLGSGTADALGKSCWHILSAGEKVGGCGATEVDVPVEAHIWRQRQGVANVPLILLSRIVSLFAWNNLPTGDCDTDTWTDLGPVTGRKNSGVNSPFYVDVALAPPSDVGRKLQLRIWLDPDHVAELRRQDQYLIEIKAGAVSQWNKTSPPWLRSKEGWHIGLAEVSQDMQPKKDVFGIGVAGLDDFFTELVKEIEPPESTISTVRSVVLSVAR